VPFLGPICYFFIGRKQKIGPHLQGAPLKQKKAEKMNIKPSKPVSMGALIVLVFMLLFAIGFAILVGNVLVDNEAPPVEKVVFILFMLAFVATVLFLLVYHILNLKRAKGLALIDIETGPRSPAAEGIPPLLPPDPDPMQRLRELEALKRDGLINEDEFKRKREDVMQQKW
jgi:hypothetical protein